MAVIDHLVYAVPDLDVTVDWFELTTGIRPAFGGAHPNMGTHNALVSLGDSYLEIIAPDPNQPEPEFPRPFGVVHDMSPQLATFAVRPSAGETIESLSAAATHSGSDPGEIVAMSRTPPSGPTLHWRLTFPTMSHDGLVPFLIDWGSTPHPVDSVPTGLQLLRLSGETADVEQVEAVLRAIELDIPVSAGSGGLVATLETPLGVVTLH